MLIWIDSITVTQTQTRERHICCEHCSHEYYYLMTRTASGCALDRTAAGHKAAQARAMRKLDRIFKREDDPVACPRCRHFQASMNFTFRRRYRAWIRRASPLAIPALMLLGLALIANSNSYSTDINDDPMLYTLGWTLMLSGPFVTVAILFLRWFIAHRHDLNEMQDVSRWTSGMPIATTHPQMSPSFPSRS